MQISLIQYGHIAWQVSLRDTPLSNPVWEQGGFTSPDEALAEVKKVLRHLEEIDQAA